MSIKNDADWRQNGTSAAGPLDLIGLNPAGPDRWHHPPDPGPPARGFARLFCFCLPRFVGTVAVVGITVQQFNQMTARVSGRKARTPTALRPAQATAATGRHQVILGLDPSLRGTGYGIIKLGGARVELIAQGTITCVPAWPKSRCLGHIAQTLREVVRRGQPTGCAVEGLFYAQNLRTALIMGEARGAALAVLAEAGLEIFEIAPRKVKQAIVGYGAAQKIAVARMVQRMLALTEVPAPDAADALALALALVQSQGRYQLDAPKRI